MMVREPVLYPRLYPWLILMASVDVLLTWHILSPAQGGIELNPIAAHVIGAGGMTAATFFKFGTVMFVMWASEVIGRQSVGTGRRVLWVALACHVVVLSIAAGQLAAYQL